MKIQGKLIASSAPILLIVFFSLGFWSYRTTRDIIREATYSRIEATLDSRINHTFKRRTDLLKATNMDKVQSFVSLYKKEAFDDLLTGPDSKMGCFFVFNGNGRPLFSSDACSDDPVLFNGYEIGRKVLGVSTHELKGQVTYKGANRIHGARYFAPWNIVLVYSVDIGAEEKSISRIFAVTTGLAGVSALACALIVALVSRKVIILPIRRLQTAAAKIANREKGVPVDVGSDDEIGGLSDSINTMAASITDHLDQLGSVTAALERANESLLNSQLALQQTASAGNVGLWDWDIRTGTAFFSPQWKKQIGYDEHEIEGHFDEWRERIHPEDSMAMHNALAASLNPPFPPYKVEFRLRHKDGSYRWILAEGALELDSKMQPSRMKGSHVDITERKLAEEALITANAQWQQTFDSVPDMVLLLGMNHRILRANRSVLDRFGLYWEQISGRFCYEIVHGTTAPPKDCPYGRIIKSGKEERSEFSDNRLGGQFEVRTAPVTDKGGIVSGCVHVVRDITEHRKLEEQLLQAQKMDAIGNLAGGIAHDFNNILAPIIGYSEIALAVTDPDNPVREDIRQILSAANRAKDLTMQILTFSRRTTYEPRPIKIQTILKEALKLLRSTIPSTIVIEENIGMDCLAIMADPTHIHQIVMNLCTNAYQAMLSTGGSLCVSLENVELEPGHGELEPGPYILLEVKDTGPGIPKQIVNRIFEPYFTTKDKGGGTGLGLSVVHGIVKRCKGDITVHSEPGNGTVFKIQLPVIVSETIQEPAGKINAPLPSGNERILLVDDEKIILDIMEKMLRHLGYRVSVFTGSEQALTAFNGAPDHYDLIISDMTMPGMTGDRLAENVFKARPDMPIILCTGYSPLISEEKARRMGVRGLLSKPVQIDTLAFSVRNALDNMDAPVEGVPLAAG
jgi:PAS domain S-box-containing protein